MKIGIILIVCLFISIITIIYGSNSIFALPEINDPTLEIQTVVTGLKKPTSMAFIGNNDILVAEQETGVVKRIVNGNVNSENFLDLNVSSIHETGLPGLAAYKDDNNSNSTHIFYGIYVYYTQTNEADGGIHIGNNLYKYNIIQDRSNNKFAVPTEPVLLLDLPQNFNYRHIGGKILLDPKDNNTVFLTVGDYETALTKASNNKDGPEAFGSGGILRISTNGSAEGILGSSHPLDKYYAYGIRNSFGIAFDPLTGNLWDTENGPIFEDEINLVLPGFNSGWTKIMGLSNGSFNLDSLVDFEGAGKYSDPEFVWNITVAPTGLDFLDSSKLGDEYINDLFVGASKGGKVYHFDLNENRTELVLKGNLTDKVANTITENDFNIFGSSFYSIIDIKTGPDGYLYILDYDGTIYRIISTNSK